MWKWIAKRIAKHLGREFRGEQGYAGAMGMMGRGCDDCKNYQPTEGRIVYENVGMFGHERLKEIFNVWAGEYLAKQDETR